MLALALAILLPPVIKIDPKVVLNTFDPRDALGAGVDGHEEGDIEHIYTPENLEAMKGTGLGALTYRLRTELSIDAWHFLPSGHFSGGEEGYWTSDWRGPGAKATYGYALPRRGNTTDEGNDSGYSRIDDGDPQTFWKSNPYLDRAFTHEGGHPQWVVVDFKRAVSLSTVKIAWGHPWARKFEIQAWQGEDGEGPTDGVWKALYRTRHGHGGDFQTSFSPVKARYLKIRLLDSARQPAKDIRDGVGFAIRELSAGSGANDEVRHGRKHQTTIYVSSTDSWHRAVDRDPGVEQPSFDTVLGSGLTRGRPLLAPVPVLFGTPDEAANEIRYLQTKGVALRGVELGEEPDGQFIEPEDYGALYLQFADAIHRVDPKVVLGGPSFEEIQVDVWNWPQPLDTSGWLDRLLVYLKAHGQNLGFLSFEWYPFDQVDGPIESQLTRAPGLLESALAKLPKNLPLVVSEYGYSAFAGQSEVNLPGAALNADIVGKFLALGGRAAYLYGYEPSPLDREGEGTWGNNAILVSDDERRIRGKTATYWGARLETQTWCAPEGGPHRLLKTESGDPRVGAYALRRPDGRIAVLLVNRSAQPITVRLDGPKQIDQLGPGEYRWRSDGPRGRPEKSGPPRHWTQETPDVELPSCSITVARL